ncbi:hypothetical protein ACIBSW_40450 [Actinoplanes sp. NPDC049668]|uniref:hypothetical protein n=1 Tax=unclassified Actinoplanes TaxID=2626549 RepID=UPI0033AB75B5
MQLDQRLIALFGNLPVPGWVVTSAAIALLIAFSLRILARIYCFVIAVRAALSDDDTDRGERALKIVEWLIKRLWR